MSQPAQTQMSRELAELSQTPPALAISGIILKGTRAKHTLVYLKLFTASPSFVDGESGEYVVMVTTRDMSRVDRHGKTPSPLFTPPHKTHNYGSSVKEK